MHSQTQPCDLWMLFCGAESKAWLEPLLAEALADLPYTEPVWIDRPFWDCAREEVAARRPAQDRLLTTRLDTDDAVAKEFLSTVREAAGTTEAGAINLLHGAQLAGSKVYLRSDPANAFISLVEEASEDPLTVFVDEHHRLGHHGPVVQVRTEPLWLQVIHDANLANSVSGIRTQAAGVLVAFDLDVVPTETAAEVYRDRIRSTLRMAWRVVSARHRLLWALRVVFSRRRR
jgi:hypothetical protein